MGHTRTVEPDQLHTVWSHSWTAQWSPKTAHKQPTLAGLRSHRPHRSDGEQPLLKDRETILLQSILLCTRPWSAESSRHTGPSHGAGLSLASRNAQECRSPPVDWVTCGDHAAGAARAWMRGVASVGARSDSACLHQDLLAHDRVTSSGANAQTPRLRLSPSACSHNPNGSPRRTAHGKVCWRGGSILPR